MSIRSNKITVCCSALRVCSSKLNVGSKKLRVCGDKFTADSSGLSVGSNRIIVCSKKLRLDSSEVKVHRSEKTLRSGRKRDQRNIGYICQEIEPYASTGHCR